MSSGVIQLDLPTPLAGPAAPRPTPYFLGPENRLLAAAVADLIDARLLDSDAAHPSRFNPLVLVGPDGFGKSHLVQGVVRHWATRRSEQELPLAVYCTAADLAREFQAASTDDCVDAWRSQLDAARLLVVEDVEHFRANSAVQLQLRQFVDERVEEGDARVIVTANRPLAALANLDLGLRDRLMAGLTLQLERPEYAARRAILAAAAEARGWHLTAKQLNLLAQREVGSAAQLFGLLTEHIAGDDSQDEAAHLATADARQDARTLSRIIAATARYFGVTKAALIGPSRRTSLVRARNVAACLARRLTELSYAEIGYALGGRDHTTVMHAQRRVQQQMAEDPAVRQAMEDLDQLLR